MRNSVRPAGSAAQRPLELALCHTHQPPQGMGQTGWHAVRLPTWRGVWPSTSLSLRSLSGWPSSTSSATTFRICGQPTDHQMSAGEVCSSSCNLDFVVQHSRHDTAAMRHSVPTVTAAGAQLRAAGARLAQPGGCPHLCLQARMPPDAHCIVHHNHAAAKDAQGRAFQQAQRHL